MRWCLSICRVTSCTTTPAYPYPPSCEHSAIFKPRFGGINFCFNKCRAAIVGPLTFFLWICWSFSRRSRNFLKSFQQSHQDHEAEQVLHHESRFQQQPAPPLTKSSDSNILDSSGTSKATTINPVHQHVHHHHQQQKQELAHAPSATLGSSSQLLWTQENNGSTKSRLSELSKRSSGNQRKGTAPHHPSSSSVCSQDGKLMHETRSHASSLASPVAGGGGGGGGEGCVLVATLDVTRSKRRKRQRRKERRKRAARGECMDASVSSSDPSFHPLDSLHWTSIDLPRIYRIKQITRSCLNDVILAAISGNNNKR